MTGRWAGLALMAAGAASAQEAAQEEVANGTAFGDWAVTCQAVTVTRNVCRLVQEQTLRDGNALVVRLIAIPAEDGEAVLLAQVPIGVYLPGGAVFRPAGDEEAEQVEMVWQRCLGDICEAAHILSVENLATLEAAGAVLFGYRTDATSEPIVTRVDTAEFGAGLEALRTVEE